MAEALPIRDNKPETMTRTRYLYAAALAIICLAGLGIRLWDIADESLWYDEIISLRFLNAPTLGQFIRQVHADSPAVTPFYFAIEYLWAHTVGGGVMSLRLLSVLMGMTCILLVYMLSAEWFGRPAGLVAALAMAMNSQHIFFSQEIRMYMLVYLIGIAAVWTLGRAIATGRREYWVANAVLNFLAVWTHPFMAPLYVPQMYLVLAPNWRRWKRALLWSVMPALSVLSAGLWLKLNDTGKMYETVAWITKPTILRTPGAPSVFDVALFWIGKHITLANTPWLNMLRPFETPADALLFIAAALLLAIACVAALKARGHCEESATPRHCEESATPRHCEESATPRHCEESATKQSPPIPVPLPNLPPLCYRQKILFLFSWLLFPQALLFALSYVWAPCYYFRYILYTSIPLYILLGAGVMAVRRPTWRGALLALLFIPLAFQAALLMATPVRPRWEAAARAVDSAIPRSVPAIGTGFHNVYAFKYMLKVPRRVIQEDDMKMLVAQIKARLHAKMPIIAVISDPKMRKVRAIAEFEGMLRESGIKWNETVFEASVPVHLYQFGF